MHRDGFALERHHVQNRQIVNQAELTLGRDHLQNLRQMLLGVGQAQHDVYLRQPDGGQLRCHGLAMVDHMVGAQGLHPLAGFRARGGADDGQAGQAPCQLHQHRAHPAGRTDHQQCFAGGFFAGLHANAVEQQLPGGNAGEWQCGGLAKVEACGHVAHDALIYQVERTVGAGPLDGACVKHPVTRFEQANLRAHRTHDATGIKTQHLVGVSLSRAGAFAQLGVDRVDGHRMHLHQQVMAQRNRVRQGDVLQPRGGGNRVGLGVTDGFHGGLSK